MIAIKTRGSQMKKRGEKKEAKQNKTKHASPERLSSC
jgi:hypothetical protein